MSYTQEDLTATQRAIAKLGAGEQVVQVRWSSGKTITYKLADLDTLERIEVKIQRALAKAAGNTGSRSRYYRTSKGL